MQELEIHFEIRDLSCFIDYLKLTVVLGKLPISGYVFFQQVVKTDKPVGLRIVRRFSTSLLLCDVAYPVIVNAYTQMFDPYITLLDNSTFSQVDV